MKPAIKILYTVIFSLFLPAGLWMGSSLGGDAAIQQLLIHRFTIPPLPTPTTGQRNILIIGVDRLSTRPTTPSRLESIWLAAYLPGQPFVTLVSIYPPLPTENGKQRSTIEEDFQLDADGAPGVKLINYLRRRQIWWSGHVILDEIAMIEIVDYLGGIPADNRRLSGAIALGEIPRPWDDSAAAIRGQTSLLKQLCRQAAQIPVNPDLSRIIALIPDNMYTNVDIQFALQEWQHLLSGESRLDCEFPLSNGLRSPEVSVPSPLLRSDSYVHFPLAPITTSHGWRLVPHRHDLLHHWRNRADQPLGWT